MGKKHASQYANFGSLRQVFGKGRHVLKKDGGLLVYASLCVSKSFFVYFQFLDNVWRLLS